ncbi:phosphoribosyltransferase family protein [Saccharopolyspora taberi]|uniref:Phosphoribosyltransferase family protein n=1 Tax=Saccharopolyspora taberi TaxID=60895 RepID=A0ABN3VG60_9PSEU
MISSALARFLPARHGHFRFESGHHGQLWLDLDVLFISPARLRPVVDDLTRRLARHAVTAVCGPLTGGAFVAQQAALGLDGLFTAAERHLDGDQVAYRVPDAVHAHLAGQRVAVVDDVLNAGSAVDKTVADLRRCEVEVVVVGGLLALGSGAQAMAARRGVPLEAVETWPHELWPPEQCPLCARGEPLTG